MGPVNTKKTRKAIGYEEKCGRTLSPMTSVTT